MSTMSFAETPSPEEAILNGYATTLTEMLLDEHAMAPAGHEAPMIQIDESPGEPQQGTAPNRPTSIVRLSANDYIMYRAHYESFKEDFQHAYNSESNPEIALKIFVGLGIAGALMQDRFANNQPSPLKQESHAKHIQEYFADHDPIDQTFREIFHEPEMSDRAFMTESLTDTRAMFINGLRLRFATLFASEAVVEYIEIDSEKLMQGARKKIRAIYERDIEPYSEVVVFGMGQDPKFADEMIFNSLPDWLIAAAAPASMRSIEHLFSEGWKHD